MKKVSLFLFGVFFVVAGFQVLANAQGGGNQMQDMQQQMMQAMQKQMMQNMGGAGGMQPGASPAKAGVPTERTAAGEAVFSDTGLGTNGKSCKTCHSRLGEKPLDGRKVDNYLSAVVQYCYVNALKGKSVIGRKKLNAIVDYFTSLEK